MQKYQDAVRIVTASPDLAALGGVELCTFQDSRALVENGNTVTLMYGSDGPQHTDYLAAHVTVSGRFAFDFTLSKALRNVFGFLSSGRFIRQIRAEILWLNRPEHIVWAQFASRIAGIPIVCHLHHMPNYRRLRLMYSGVSHFIAVSRFIRQEWIEQGIEPERISVIHNSISTTDYPFGGRTEQGEARSELGLPPEVPIVLFYGLLSRQKGVVTLAKAWLSLGEKRGDALLLIVGQATGVVDAEFDKVISELPKDSFRLMKHQKAVVPLLHAADVVVLPSWHAEAFGRVVLEGLATGRPVIASNVGGVPEILSGEMSRFLVEPEDVEGLAAKLAEILHWRDSEPGLATRCHAWVENRFPYADHVRALENTLREHRRPSRSDYRFGWFATVRSCRSSPNRSTGVH